MTVQQHMNDPHANHPPPAQQRIMDAPIGGRQPITNNTNTNGNPSNREMLRNPNTTRATAHSSVPIVGSIPPPIAPCVPLEAPRLRRPSQPPSPRPRRFTSSRRREDQVQDDNADVLQGNFQESPHGGFQDIRTPHGGIYGRGIAVARSVTDDPTEQLKPPSTIEFPVPNQRAMAAGAALGLICGIVLSHLDAGLSVAKWIQMPGDLYLRAITCFVVPLVFINVAVSVADLVHIDQGKRLSVRALFFFIVTTVLALFEGFGVGFLSRAFLHYKEANNDLTLTDIRLGVQCSNGLYWTVENSTGLVSCSATSVNETSATIFIADDLTHGLVLKSSAMQPFSLSDNLLKFMNDVVPDNFFMPFGIHNLVLAIVVLAISCGITLSKSFRGPVQLNPMLEFLREINELLVIMVTYVVKLTPLALFCLFAGSFGTDNSHIMVDVSALVIILEICALFIATVVIHTLLVMPVLASVVTGGRINPFIFMKDLLPVYIYTMGCSSSMAALPVSLQCISQCQAVSGSMAYFVMSLGTAINKTGTAIYLPMVTLLMVDLCGLKSEVGVFQHCMLFLVAFLGSLAASPVPGGSVAMAMTLWRLVMSKYELPSMYALLLAADVVIDRVVTFCNVNANAMICRMLAEKTVEPQHHPMRR